MHKHHAMVIYKGHGRKVPHIFNLGTRMVHIPDTFPLRKEYVDP
jgi:hypothetical protein